MRYEQYIQYILFLLHKSKKRQRRISIMQAAAAIALQPPNTQCLYSWLYTLFACTAQAESLGTKILDEDELLELIRTKPGKKSKYEIAAEAEVSTPRIY